MITPHKHELKVIDLGIDTYSENIIFMRSDCPVAVSEGFKALTRVIASKGDKKIVATLNIVTSEILKDGETGLSAEAMKRLAVVNGDVIYVSHLHPIESLSFVRAKLCGKELDEDAFREIITDVVAGHYSNIELAAFVSACSGDNMTVNEIIHLTKAMINSGTKISWDKKMILDKHCVGGLPGNRTTPIVVSIIAAAGLTIPKTSSRAITSPAGTADVMERMAPVNLTIDQLKNIVNEVGGCVAWGGEVKLSPADDLLIAVEKALDIDSDGQMVASVLSKKAAAGSTHILIDIPVGPTAKVRTNEQALKLQYYFKAVSDAIGIRTETVITDGAQPVGRGMGPTLEAMDVLAVLQNKPDAPQDLKERSLYLASALLRLSGSCNPGTEEEEARKILESGMAYEKFRVICKAQGGFREPEYAKYRFDFLSVRQGKVTNIDNRRLARIAKLAGAPTAYRAGLWLNVHIGKEIKKGALLFSIYAESNGELEYTKEYLNKLNGIIDIE